MGECEGRTQGALYQRDTGRLTAGFAELAAALVGHQWENLERLLCDARPSADRRCALGAEPKAGK